MKDLKRIINNNLAKPSLRKWMARCVFDWIQIAFIFIFFLKFKTNIFVILVSGLLLAIKQHSLAMLMHDGSHGQISLNHKVNNLICNLTICYPLFDHLDIFRTVHMLHHWRSGDKIADPEQIYKANFLKNFQFPYTHTKVFLCFIKDFIGFSFMESLWFSCIKERKNIRREVPLIIFWIFVLVLLHMGFGVLASYTVLMWGWVKLGPFVAISRLRMMTEHTGDAGAIPHRFHFNPVLRWVITPHNTYHHYEHHMYPSVPCWNLGEVRELIGDDVKIMSSKELYEKIFKSK